MQKDNTPWYSFQKCTNSLLLELLYCCQPVAWCAWRALGAGTSMLSWVGEGLEQAAAASRAGEHTIHMFHQLSSGDLSWLSLYVAVAWRGVALGWARVERGCLEPEPGWTAPRHATPRQTPAQSAITRRPGCMTEVLAPISELFPATCFITVLGVDIGWAATGGKDSSHPLRCRPAPGRPSSAPSPALQSRPPPGPSR